MKKFNRLLILITTTFSILLYLLTSATAYISPIDFSLATLLSIAYIPILVLYVVVMLCWFFRSKRVFLALLLLFFAGYKNLSATVATNVFAGSWKQEKATGTIRVMSWNVNKLGTLFIEDDSANSIRRKMLAYIKEVNPDILCLQDLQVNQLAKGKGFYVDNISDLLSIGNFTSYHYLGFLQGPALHYTDRLGVAVFSKFPLLDTGSFRNEGFLPNEKTAYIDLQIQSKPIRIFISHLSSFSLWPSDSAGIKYLEGDSSKYKAKSILSKVNYFGKLHAHEADVIKDQINKSPYPILFTADLNSVPSGYVYRRLKENLVDAFLEKDFGIGGTYNRVFPKLRIDVMLHSKELKVVQFARPVVDLSDHYPIIADIRWKE